MIASEEGHNKSQRRFLFIRSPWQGGEESHGEDGREPTLFFKIVPIGRRFLSFRSP